MDVSRELNLLRTAAAEARVRATPALVDIIQAGKVPQGDPFTITRTAAILAARRTPELVAFCPTATIESVEIEFKMEENDILIRAEIKAFSRSCVDIFALSAVTAASLNLIDLLRPFGADLSICEAKNVELPKIPFAIPDTFRCAIVVVSDRAHSGEYEDRTGPALQQALERHGGQITSLRIVPDVSVDIHEAVLAGEKHAQIVIAAGGTGLGPRDVTPGVIEGIIEERLPGIEAQIHAYSRDRIPTAMLSRLVAGRRTNVLFFAIPGSPGASLDVVAALFPHLKHALAVMGADQTGSKPD